MPDIPSRTTPGAAPDAAPDPRTTATWGGVAALVGAATYVVGFALLATVLAPLAGGLDAPQFLAFLVERHDLLYLWNLIIYVINGAFLVVLVLALHARLRSGAPFTAQLATAFGLVWSGLVIASGMLILHDLGVVSDLAARDPEQAAIVWTALQAVENGLGGGVELPGGLWVLLVSWAATRTRTLPRALNALGAVAGAAGILTLLPADELFGAVFGLGMIVWFVVAGVVLLRGRDGRTVAAVAVAGSAD